MKSVASALFWLGLLGMTVWFLNPTWASDPRIDSLRDQVRHLDVETRISALRELARENTLPAFKTMLLAVYDSDERVRLEIERSVAAFNAPEVKAWLSATGIHYPDKWVRFYSVHAYIQTQGAGVLPELLAGIDKTYPEVQALILDRIGSSTMTQVLAQEEILAPLGAILGPGRAPRLWLKAVNLLRASNTPRAAELLVAALEDKDAWPPRALVSFIHNALARMKAPGIADRMKVALASAKTRAAKLGALAALGSSAEAAGLQAISDFIKAEPDPDLRAGAVSALGRAGTPEAANALGELATVGPSVPDALMAASVLLEQPGAVPADKIKPALEDAKADFRLRGLLAEYVHRTESAGKKPDLDEPMNQAESIAMRRSLTWLVRTQEDDGHWATSKHNPNHGKHGFPSIYAPDADDYYDVATTGWCLLALLADRHHLRPSSYSESVRKAVTWLLAHQKPNGMFKADKDPEPPAGGGPEFATQSQNVWATNHLVATLAMLEASFQTGRARKDGAPGGSQPSAEEKQVDEAATKGANAITDKPLEGEYNWFNAKIVNLPRLNLLAAIRYTYAKRAAGLGLQDRDISSTVTKFTMESLNKIAESATTVKVPFDRNGNYWFRAYASSAQAINAAVYLTPKQVGLVPIHEFITQRMDLLRMHPARWNPFYEIVGPTGHPPATEPAVAEATQSSLYTNLGLMPDAWKDDIVNFEYWFFATNAFFIVGEDDWFTWRGLSLPVIADNQDLIGTSYGSWEPEGPQERVLGRCTATAWGSLVFGMGKRVLNMHNVMWHRVVKRGGYRPPAKKEDEKGGKDEKAGGKTDDKAGGKAEHPGGKMDDPTGEKK